MVFSVNAIESSENNFETFQARARQLNGTDSNSMATSSTISDRVITFERSHCAGFVTVLLTIAFGIIL